MTNVPVLDSTIQKTHEWLKDITDGLGFPNQRSAFAALRATLHALRDRLPREHAAQLGAQLPMLIRGLYYEGWDPSREPTRIRHQQEFFDLVSAELKEHDELRDARRVTRIVFGVLAKHLSPGEKEKVLLTLPEELRELWVSEPKKVRVKDIMSKNVTWVGPDLSLQDAAKKMRELDIGCLPVGKDDRLIGMITDRDIACRAVAEGDDPAKTMIAEAMSKGVTYCFEDQEVSEAARLMEKKQIHRLPVLNRQKRMVGMLSLGDVGLHAPHELTGEGDRSRRTSSGTDGRDHAVNQGFGLPGEFELIARYFAPLAKGFPGAYGLLDDAAVIAPAPGNELVAKTDAIIGGVHFLADDAPDLVARKALRVNLSDLAAKGAVARAYLLDLMLPNTIGEAWIAGFAHGLAQDQFEYGVHLIGGDTDSTPGPVTIAIMAFGEIATGRIIRRGGAHPGDMIFVTGTIGDAALGLEVLRGRLPGLDPASAGFLVERYRLPLPRVTVGPQLIGLATAALDVSDGLIADLGHICEVSDLTAVIEAPRVPLSPAVRMAVTVEPERLATVLTGGDDYEILFTAPQAATAELAELSHTLGVAITAIGHMMTPSARAEKRVTVVDVDGRPLRFAYEGWRHF